MSSPSTSSSFDLAELLERSDYGPSLLLEEPIDLSSSDSVTLYSSTSTVPPFNRAYKPPLFTLVGLGAKSPMFPNGIQLSNIYGNDDCHDHDDGPCVITIPTLGRMPNILYEPICVLNWVRNVTTLEAPGHVPWEAPQAFDPSVFVPERPIIKPRQTSREEEEDLPPWTPSPARLSKPFRDALVFEREITLTSDGTTRRWSLQVPASSMDPETVGYMLELRELNSFFASAAEKTMTPGPISSPNEKDVIAPSLMVSNSSYTLPVSFESSDYLSPNPPPSPLPPSNPIPLAIRRGKKMLPALTPRKQPTLSSYPSIPTPFRGSPHAYLSPSERELGQIPPPPGLELEDMVANLRSHCLPLIPKADNRSNTRSQTACQPSGSQSSDEWAFAGDWLSKYGDHPLTRNICKPNLRDDYAISPTESTQLHRPNSSASTSSANSTCGDATDYQCSLMIPPRPMTIHQNPITPPPSLPLPQRPALCSTPSKEIRGILKSSKSVRFANSPPSRRQTAPVMETPVPCSVEEPKATSMIGAPLRKLKGATRRNTVAHNSPPPPGRTPNASPPSTIKPLLFGPPLVPLTSVVVSQPPVTVTSTKPTLPTTNDRVTRRPDNLRSATHKLESIDTKRPISTPVTTTPSTNFSSAIPTRQPQSAPALKTRRAVVSAGKENFIPHFSIRRPQVTPLRRVTTSGPETPQSDPASARSSTRASKGSIARLGLPGGSDSPKTLDDSTTSAPGSDSISSSKSKMPVPLRNILTRFR